MKKWGSIILSSVLMISLFAGCSSSGSTTASDTKATTKTTAAPADKKQETVKLTMWGAVPAESGPQAVIDAWNKSNPNVQVEYVRFVNDDDGNLKLDTALLTGQNADIYVNYTIPHVQKRIKAGVALDLGQFTDYNIDQKMGPDAKLWQVDGKYYGMPTTKNVFFVALNKDELDAAKLPIPDQWTWDDMRDYAKKLKGSKPYGLVQDTEPYVDPIDSILTKKGITKTDGTSNLDDPSVKKWLETLNGMMKDDKTTPPLGEQLTSKMPVTSVFLKGDAAMINIGAWLLRDANNFKDNPRTFKIAFAPVPRLTENASDNVTRGGLGDYISINGKSSHTKEAWEFLKWYADKGMGPMAAGGRLPASKDADLDAATKSLLGDHPETYDLASLKKVLFENKTPTYVRSTPQQVMDLRREEYEKFFLGSQTADQAIANMVKRHNALLKK
jgi:multiple sugar transport system substrate-binding protein